MITQGPCRRWASNVKRWVKYSQLLFGVVWLPTPAEDPNPGKHKCRRSKPLANPTGEPIVRRPVRKSNQNRGVEPERGGRFIVHGEQKVPWVGQPLH